jgi:DNA-binding SARP family transcriptional activator
LRAAARKALGFGPEAEPYLPAALKTGHYRISDLVTVDVTRAVRFVVAARNAPDAAEAIALYRAALDLVEGEPVSGILSGYAWWQSEGHAGRVRGLLVEAACGIARLASASGPGGLVEWALGQARAVDPYSEELTQAAMRWAAESGDADRLRREWAECRRMVDELDPGGVPSARTEALYAELTRRTSAGIDSRRERGAGGSQASLAAMEAAPRSTEPSAP